MSYTCNHSFNYIHSHTKPTLNCSIFLSCWVAVRAQCSCAAWSRSAPGTAMLLDSDAFLACSCSLDWVSAVLCVPSPSSYPQATLEQQSSIIDMWHLHHSTLVNIAQIYCKHTFRNAVCTSLCPSSLRRLVTGLVTRASATSQISFIQWFLASTHSSEAWECSSFSWA